MPIEYTTGTSTWTWTPTFTTASTSTWNGVYWGARDISRYYTDLQSEAEHAKRVFGNLKEATLQKDRCEDVEISEDELNEFLNLE